MLITIYEKYPFLKKYFLTPFAFNTNPNKISLFALISAFFAGGLFFHRQYVAGALFVLLNGYLDLLDGEIAKKHNRARPLGDFIDHFFDRVSDVVIILPLALAPHVSVYIVSAAVILMLLASYLGVESQALLKKRNYAGIGGRAERLVIVFFTCLLVPFYNQSIVIGLYIISLLCLATIAERFYDTYTALDKIKEK